MHHIQKQILQQLVYQPQLRFAQLKPIGLESNHFIYHLKKLLEDGLVLKKTNAYALSSEGRAYADRLSLQSFKPRIQAKIVTLIVIQNAAGEFLLYRRKHQPFIGLVGFPYGKTHLGEKLQEAAERELQEKTSLTATLKHSGDVYLTVFENGQVLSHMLAHIFTGKNPKGKLQNRSQKGFSFWTKVADVKTEDCLPGFLDIYKQVTKKSHSPFFKEFVYQLP